MNQFEKILASIVIVMLVVASSGAVSHFIECIDCIGICAIIIFVGVIIMAYVIGDL